MTLLTLTLPLAITPALLQDSLAALRVHGLGVGMQLIRRCLARTMRGELAMRVEMWRTRLKDERIDEEEPNPKPNPESNPTPNPNTVRR